MSFSNEVRNEAVRIIPEKTCCRRAELAAFMAMRAETTVNEDGTVDLQLMAENAAMARKIYRLLKKVSSLQVTASVIEKKRFKQKRSYLSQVTLQSADVERLQSLGLLDQNGAVVRYPSARITAKTCCKRAYLRGVFICKGFVNRPEGNYHLEMVFNDQRMANEIKKIANKLGIETNISERKNNMIVYIKDSETIVDFLRLIETSQALLEFENVRIIKSMRNQVNRQVNCETANLSKTIDASVRQIELIEALIAQRGVNKIPLQLRELALLRLEHPDSALRELGTMMDPPLTKSGVAYRMRKLEKFAEENLND